MDNQIEQKRNKLLRRADWRFLLENPLPERNVCFTNGFLSRATQAISSRSISAESAVPGESDLVVASNPNALKLRKAWDVLQPGGEIYIEWYSPLAVRPSRIREQLEKAGFTNVKCYWPWPMPAVAPALFWLPLEAPQTLDYFLANRQYSKNLLARTGSNVALFFWKLLLKTGLLAPVCVTAQKPGLQVSPTFSGDLVHGESGHWGEKGSLDNAHHFDTLMWTGGKRSINKIVLYKFAPGDNAPSQVVKLPRTPEAIPALMHEAQILQALHGRKSGPAKGASALRASGPASRAPQVLFLRDTKGVIALGETTLYGKPMYTILDKENALDMAIKVTEWLASLAEGEPLCPREIWWNRLVEPALAVFEREFKPVLDDITVTKCRAILNQLPALPQVFEHRDCSPWNLLITPGNELAVLDWESAEPDGLPALDLTYFLTYLGFFLDGAMQNQSFIDSYRRISDEKGFSGHLWSTCQQLYITRLGLDPAVLHPLRLLTWMIHSHSEARRLSEDAGGSPGPSALQHSLFYNLVLEEVRKDVPHLEGILP